LIDRTLEVEASLDSLRSVGLWMRDATRAAGVPYEVAFGVDLAVHEAVENVVTHGGAARGSRWVRLRFRSDSERVEVQIEDDGRAFDPLTVEAPQQPLRIEEIIPGGQGIHLMRHFTDALGYRREGDKNVLTLTRRLAESHSHPVSLDPVVASPFFSGLRREDLRILHRAGRLVRFDPGTVVVRPDEPAPALQFVLKGALEVRLEETSTVVNSIEAGECFGEMGVIDGRPASAWVVAVEPCELLRVSEERVFDELLAQPGFSRGLLRLMSSRLRATLDRQAAWDQMRKELRLAREIQSSMLPPPGSLFPDHPEIDCAAAMEPAAEVAGDFYDAFFIDEKRLFVAVGDVAGKGMAAALFMARSLALLRAEALRRRPLRELLARVNEALVQGNEQGTFVAATCCVLDTTSGTLRVANGGGGAPFLRSDRGSEPLSMPRGIVLGAIPGFAFETGRARLGPGESLLLFSDGVTEARSPQGELFGKERLLEVLARHGDADAAALVRGVREAVAEFAGAGPPADDLTLFVVRRLLAPPPLPPSAPPEDD